MIIKMHRTGSPTPPVNIRHSVLRSSAEGASVSVQWDPPTDNGGRDDLNYTVTISPQVQLSATVVTSTSVTVSANYNEDYTVSVVAQSCVNRTSMAGRYIFNVGEFQLFSLVHRLLKSIKHRSSSHVSPALSPCQWEYCQCNHSSSIPC